MPAFLAVDNLLNGAGVDLTASSEFGGLGIQSVLTEPLGDVWRFTGNLNGAQTYRESQLNVNFPSAKNIKFFALGAPRQNQLPMVGCQIGITASNVAPSGTEVYAGPWTNWEMPRGMWVFYFATAITAMYWTIRFRLNPLQPYGQLGRLWCGQGLQTATGMAAGGNSFGMSDTAYEAPRRGSKISLPLLTESEADQAEDMMLNAGTQRQIFFIGDTSRLTRMSMFGRFASLETASPLEYWNETDNRPYYSMNLSVKEDK